MSFETVNSTTNKFIKSFAERSDKQIGGTKSYGYGRQLSEPGINDFVNKKLVRISDLSDPF
jgi:hypothetical protein